MSDPVPVHSENLFPVGTPHVVVFIDRVALVKHLVASIRPSVCPSVVCLRSPD